MPRPPNYRASLQARLGARDPHEVKTRAESTVDKDGVLVLIGEDVPREKSVKLVQLCVDKLRRSGG